MDPEIQLPVLLKAKKSKAVLYLLICFAFTDASFLLIPEKPLIAYLGILLFGLGAVALAVLLIPGVNYQLELTEDGFTLCGLFRKSSFSWGDIEEFFIIDISLNEMVAWNFSDSYEKQAGGRSVAKALGGAEAAFPDAFGMSEEELLELLNSLLEKYGKE